MRELIYLLWLSVPASLFILSGMIKVRDLVLQLEPESARASWRLFKYASFTLFCSSICFFLDWLILEGKGPFQLDIWEADLLQLTLLPITLGLAAVLGSMVRFLVPERETGKFSMEVRSSNSIMLVAAILVMTGVIAARANTQQGESLWSYLGTKRYQRDKSLLDDFAWRWHQITLHLTFGSGIDSSSTPEPSQQKSFSAAVLPLPDFSRAGFASYDRLVTRYAREQGADPEMLRAVVEVGSGYNVRHTSPDGYAGLAHLSSRTAAESGVRDVFDPEQNLRGGAFRLRQMVQAFPENYELAIAAYKAGLDEVKNANSVPEELEVKLFVKRVLESYEYLKAESGHAPGND